MDIIFRSTISFLFTFLLLPFGMMGSDCDSIIKGDIDRNGQVNEADIDSFLSNLANGKTGNSVDFDLNGDGNINVADAVNLNNCLRYKSNTLRKAIKGVDYCSFPAQTNDLNDTVELNVGDINSGQNYFDITIRNPYHKVLAFELKLTRLEIIRVENIMISSKFEIRSSNGGHILGLAKEEESIPINIKETPFLRVYCKKIQSFDFAFITSLINENYERMIFPIRTNLVEIVE